MRCLRLGLLAVAALLAADGAWACIRDHECPPRHRCVREFGTTPGICERSFAAPDSGGRERFGGPRSRIGDACEANLHCPVGLACVKKDLNRPGRCERPPGE